MDTLICVLKPFQLFMLTNILTVSSHWHQSASFSLLHYYDLTTLSCHFKYKYCAVYVNLPTFYKNKVCK